MKKNTFMPILYDYPMKDTPTQPHPYQFVEGRRRMSVPGSGLVAVARATTSVLSSHLVYCAVLCPVLCCTALYCILLQEQDSQLAAVAANYLDAACCSCTRGGASCTLQIAGTSGLQC